MNNSITNGLHAMALAIYSFLVYEGYSLNRQFFELRVFFLFFLVFILKIFGIIVHLPAVERDRSRYNFFWIIISVLIVILNGVTFWALHANGLLAAAAVFLTAILCGVYIRSLFTGKGDYYLIAAAFIFVYLICSIISAGELRTAWLCVLVSNILWLALSRVPVLLKYKLHNDIYHFALITSTYLLYRSIPTVLWHG